jgi:hypothetical protein
MAVTMTGLPLKVECKPPLSYDGTALVEPAAFVEAVTHHALCKQKKDECQNDYKQQHSNPKPGWLSPFRGRRIRIGCHQNRLCAKSTACHGTAIYINQVPDFSQSATAIGDTAALKRSGPGYATPE